MRKLSRKPERTITSGLPTIRPVTPVRVRVLRQHRSEHARDNVAKPELQSRESLDLEGWIRRVEARRRNDRCKWLIQLQAKRHKKFQGNFDLVFFEALAPLGRTTFPAAIQWSKAPKNPRSQN